MLLEEGILTGGRLGWVGHMHYLDVQERYPRAWKAIYLELKPKEFRELMEYERRQKQRDEKQRQAWARQEKAEGKKALKEWRAAGGKK